MDVSDVADVHVGAPPGPLSSWAIRRVHFRGFEGLPATRGAKVLSPAFSCFGRQWTVEICPGGVEGSNEGGVAVYLHNASPESIQAQYKLA